MSQLSVVGGDEWSQLTRQWAGALNPLVVRHPGGWPVLLTLLDGEEPRLQVELAETRDSRDPEVVLKPFIISTVTLTYFPGLVLARQWFAAAFCGYCQHEALERVTVGGLTDRPLDPHAEPFAFDRGLRDGLPVLLTPETLERALCVVMAPDAARALMEAS